MNACLGVEIVKQALLREARSLVFDVAKVFWVLVKIMVPAILIVKLLEETGSTEYLAWLLSPLMSLVGLPDSMGLVWATAMLSNIYAGMVVFFSVSAGESLSVAQVTVLGTMILVAHALPIEGAVAKMAGVSWRATLLIRVGGALVLGVILHWIYSTTGYLSEQNVLLWQPTVSDSSLSAWLVDQVFMFAYILLIIAALMLMLRLLRWLGIERLMHWLLAPVLKLLGIGKEASNVTIIGMTLGLGFGGGLLIQEARSGRLSRRDVFLSMALLALCHSVIEDTLLIMLLGADLSGILWARLIFALIVVAVMARVMFRSERPMQAASS